MSNTISKPKVGDFLIIDFNDKLQNLKLTSHLYVIECISDKFRCDLKVFNLSTCTIHNHFYNPSEIRTYTIL